MNETRQIVVPGEVVGSADEHLPGQNTYQEGRSIRALRLGVKSVRGDRINVIGLSGRYEPARGDMVIGTVAELGPSNWYIGIGAANDVGMHVNDVPWRVEFGETSKYLAIGDTVLLKIVHVDEMKKAQVTMKDRACRKLTGGLIWDVSPTKVPRIVGRNGSMIQLIKDATSVRIFVGQNGKVWLDGEPADVALALEALNKIEAEAHTTGLTDRMKAWLEERRPSASRPARAAEDEEPSGEPEQEFRPRERRPRPKVVRDDEEMEDDRPPRREREDRGERRGHREERGRGDRGDRGDRAERGDRGERRGPHREERGERGRPERDERRGGPRDERPARRFEEREERPARRFEEAPPARRGREERDERPRRDERPVREERPRRYADEAEDERPARRPRFDDEEERPARAPARDERPARRPEREERRPAMPRRFEDEDEEEARPPRRERELPRREAPRRAPADDEDEEDRPLRRSAFRDEAPRRAAPPPARRAREDDDEEDDRPVRDSGRHESHHSPRRARGGRGRKED